MSCSIGNLFSSVDVQFLFVWLYFCSIDELFNWSLFNWIFVELLLFKTCRWIAFGELTWKGANNEPCDLGSAREKGGAGQPCLWWSQGCSIGCDYCLTDPRHPDNNGSIPTTPITGNLPHADKAGFRKSYCENPKTQDVLPKQFWTMNMQAVPRAQNDSYRCKESIINSHVFR